MSDLITKESVRVGLQLLVIDSRMWTWRHGATLSTVEVVKVTATRFKTSDGRRWYWPIKNRGPIEYGGGHSPARIYHVDSTSPTVLNARQSARGALTFQRISELERLATRSLTPYDLGRPDAEVLRTAISDALAAVKDLIATVHPPQETNHADTTSAT